mmetsp:Transcript_25673/g.67363  ORF Transcript_25673/g.67363 Transcript_25673/m.67363 type:complete len:263 (+) Transcript_25673:747-1535(+)
MLSSVPKTGLSALWISWAVLSYSGFVNAWLPPRALTKSSFLLVLRNRAAPTSNATHMTATRISIHQGNSLFFEDSAVDAPEPSVGAPVNIGIGVTGDSVGCWVGDCVGDAVGDVVGDGDGSSLGNDEGTVVGAPVEASDGVNVGVFVGAAVGVPVVGLFVGVCVGANVGSRVGSAVGLVDGVTVGRTVGSVVGVVVGVNVGALVGETVGTLVGDWVWHATGEIRVTKPADSLHAHANCVLPCPIVGPAVRFVVQYVEGDWHT